jgi:D-lactate dehydrogenase
MSVVLEGVPAASVKSGAGHDHLVPDLTAIVGKQYVLTDESKTRRYRTGIRFGTGRALAVVQPG